MGYSRFGLPAAIALAVMGTTDTAQAVCSNSYADVTITCPNPVPYSGARTLTPTSRNLPTVGTPGLYKNWGNGYDVRVYLYKNGTGFQPFHWEVDAEK
ncbi:MAG: hypothetical protein QNJ20_13245 [Paracoccaceae bacterium]|nr:hypothetical protein [Paracoccaceae bacterium]